MGEYLNWLIKDMEKGICREEAMQRAAKSYSSKWGVDKVIINT